MCFSLLLSFTSRLAGLKDELLNLETNKKSLQLKKRRREKIRKFTVAVNRKRSPFVKYANDVLHQNDSLVLWGVARSFLILEKIGIS